MVEDRLPQTDTGSRSASPERSRVVTDNSFFIVVGGVFVGTGDPEMVKLWINHDGYGNIIEIPNKKGLPEIR